MKFLDENGLQYFWSKLKTSLSNKVDKITGKGLSTEDFTSTEKTKLAGLSNYDDTAISSRVTNLENDIASMPSGKGASGTGTNAEIFNDYTNNTATGNYSHAEGSSTTAWGQGSHAEGLNTKANACSHAEGYNTYAGDEFNFETSNTIGAHAEGWQAEARGAGAHAEGCNTYAYSYDITKPQHAQGRYNVKDENGKYAFIIGNGTSGSNRHNAFAIDWNGLIYVNGSSTGVDVSALANSVTSGSSALLTSRDANTTLSAKANSSDLGTADSKDYTTEGG